jgi:signal transduction histidine kinase
MLSEFIRKNHDEIVDRSRARVAQRSAPRPTDAELSSGIPLFLDQLVDALAATSGGVAIGAGATRHGADLSRTGFTIAQVVHDYGDLCQTITELALEQSAPISTEDFRNLNRCLDDAIAGAVTEYARLREASRDKDETERLGFLAHELRNKINSAMLAYGILKEGQLGLGGSTGAVLERSLRGLQELITRSLTEVRVESGNQHRERIKVRDLMEELEAEASMAANAHGQQFTVGEVDAGLEVDADRPLLAAALTNLLSNAFKFTHAKGHVWLRTSATNDCVTFDVEDQCGGLPVSNPDDLFAPWSQSSSDKGGLGLGLPLTRRSVEANGGEVSVRNMPGKGCIFSIRLRRPAPSKGPVSPDEEQGQRDSTVPFAA